jgi:hypothetical protein
MTERLRWVRATAYAFVAEPEEGDRFALALNRVAGKERYTLYRRGELLGVFDSAAQARAKAEEGRAGA